MTGYRVDSTEDRLTRQESNMTLSSAMVVRSPVSYRLLVARCSAASPAHNPYNPAHPRSPFLPPCLGLHVRQKVLTYMRYSDHA